MIAILSTFVILVIVGLMLVKHFVISVPKVVPEKRIELQEHKLLILGMGSPKNNNLLNQFKNIDHFFIGMEYNCSSLSDDCKRFVDGDEERRRYFVSSSERAPWDHLEEIAKSMVSYEYVLKLDLNEIDKIQDFTFGNRVIFENGGELFKRGHEFDFSFVPKQNTLFEKRNVKR